MPDRPDGQLVRIVPYRFDVVRRVPLLSLICEKSSSTYALLFLCPVAIPRPSTGDSSTRVPFLALWRPRYVPISPCLALPPYLPTNASLVCARGKKQLYLYLGTGAPRPSMPAPLCKLGEWMDRWMEYASLQTCNAAFVCAHTKTHASVLPFPFSRARVCT